MGADGFRTPQVVRWDAFQVEVSKVQVVSTVGQVLSQQVLHKRATIGVVQRKKMIAGIRMMLK